MPHTSFIVGEKTNDFSKGEKLTVTPNGIKGLFKAFTGESGEYWVSILPSLNVSGYGKTEEEALENLKENSDLFWQDIYSLGEIGRNAELKKLGWTVNRIFKKKFSKAFIDEKGVLQNFDHPEKVKQNLLQSA